MLINRAIMPLEKSERFSFSGNRLTIRNVSLADEGQYLASVTVNNYVHVLYQCVITLNLSGKISAPQTVYSN